MNTVFTSPFFRVLLAALLGMGVLALAAYVNLVWQEAKYVSGQTATINVQGNGESLAVPDIATFRYSVVAEAETAAAAQDSAASSNNDIIAYLEETAEVAERDIQTTQYNLQPRYEYEDRSCAPGVPCPPGERTLVGYEVRQTVEVRVRDTDTAGELLSGVGERGATDISSLQFTIDDDATYVAEARAEAIADARERAEALADELGVRIVGILNFNESGGGVPPGFGRAEMAFDQEGMGGGVSPEVPVGENTITRSVNITYEIR